MKFVFKEIKLALNKKVVWIKIGGILLFLQISKVIKVKVKSPIYSCFRIIIFRIKLKIKLFITKHYLTITKLFIALTLFVTPFTQNLK